MGLDAATGRVRSRVPLVEFRDLWRGQLPCQAAVVEEKIVAAVGGCVLCCDVAGRVHWVRRQVWIPPPSVEYSSGREWIDQAFSPPVVEEGLVFATQPGVWAVECMELEGGRLRWRQPLGGLVRLLGLARDQGLGARGQGSGFRVQGSGGAEASDGASSLAPSPQSPAPRVRLIAETTDGLVGLDADSGRVVWSLEVRDRLETLLCGPQGGDFQIPYPTVLAVHLGPKKDDKFPKADSLEWIDPQTGRRLGRSTLKPPAAELAPPRTDLKSVLPQPAESWLKPVVAAEGRLWGLWGRSRNRPSGISWNWSASGRRKRDQKGR